MQNNVDLPRVFPAPALPCAFVFLVLLCEKISRFGQAPRIYTPYIYMKTLKFKRTTALALARLPAVMVFSILFISVLFASSLLVSGCTDRFPSGYILEFPQVPELWISLLGEPHWRVVWLDPAGRKQTTDILSGGNCTGRIKIELPMTWANPVTAWPYWPGYNLIPGMFRPAGALFPFDVNNERLRLSWNAGIDAIFYWELAFAQSGLDTLDAGRLPFNFDWSRFRELFESEATNEAVREDPWVVDWRSVAERTVAGSFDRRRLVPETVTNKTIPVPAGSFNVNTGFWFGTSPFAKPLFFAEDEPSVFPVRFGMNVWVSTDGILRVNDNVWVFTKN